MSPDERGVARLALVAIVVAGLVVGSAAVAGQSASDTTRELTRGEPDIEVYVPEPELVTGTEQSLDVQIANEGNVRLGVNRDRVTTARAVTVEVVDDGPFDVKSGKSSVGSIKEGQAVTAAQLIEVPEDLAPGEYDVDVEVEYTYTRQVSDGSKTTDERTGSDTFTLTLEVPEEPSFEISDVETDVEPGGNGPATLEIENVGTETARQVRATVTGGGGVTVDGEIAEEVLGDLEPRESTSVTVDVAIADTTSEGAKPIDVEFTYRDESGVEREGGVETASLAPAPEQTFLIATLRDTLAVGYDGVVTGEITNDGPRTVDDAVLIVEPQSESLFVEDARYALPTIEPGETAAFRYPTDVSGQADPGPRQLRFTVEYSGGDRTRLADGPISKRVVVDPKADEFSIESVEAAVGQGQTGDLVLEITNERPETLSNVDARLYTDSPLDTDDDEAFVPALEPGESARIAFDLTAEADAPAKVHPVELDFQYDTERGDTVVSDTYQHPVVVEAVEDDGGLGIGGLLVRGMAVLSVAGGGVALWWRWR